MTDILTSNNPDIASRVTALNTKFESMPETAQLKEIQALADGGEAGLQVLTIFLRDRHESLPISVKGKAYHALFEASIAEGGAREAIARSLQECFPQGIVPLQSERGIDYAPLQQELARGNFKNADRITLEKLCELAGEDAIQRKWLYFTEVERFPTADLLTLDRLWLARSEGRFGYSVQREIWLALGKNWEKLWAKIGWKQGNQWTRYPDGFVWDASAPRGHLPLSNQLRGVRSFASLLNHSVWSS